LNGMRGFSLIELIVGMAILGILMSIGIPAFSDWMRNARVRTTAESVLNGLQLARAEAVRRNTTVGLYLVTNTTNSCELITANESTAGVPWIVSVNSPVAPTPLCHIGPSDDTQPIIIQTRGGTESGSAATNVTTDVASVVFNGLGRSTGGNVTIDFERPAGEACREDGGPVRCLRVVVSVGGQIRMCDPALPDTDAQGCG